VDSYQKNYAANGSFSEEIQGPVADDSTYDSFGIFLQDDMFMTDSLELILGARYTYIDVNADKVRDPVTKSKTSFSKDWDSFIGSVRALYHVDRDDHYNIFWGISQSFRAPNLSDLTRFDTARSKEIETAALDLDPEKYITYEIGVKARMQKFSSQLSYYYTDIKDMIVRTPTGTIIDGNMEVTKKNSGDGYLHGVELNLNYRIHPSMTMFGSFAWIDGEVDTYPTSSPVKQKEPIDKLMPTTYHGGIRWAPLENCWLEGLVTRAEKQDDLSTGDKNDTDRIPPGGTPGYVVYDIRGGWNINKYFSISAALENIIDEDYRIHGSGQNEPGRNLIIALDCRF
jgi:hemoglobin/transferrin/lactoferrin receptor protein